MIPVSARWPRPGGGMVTTTGGIARNNNSSVKDSEDKKTREKKKKKRKKSKPTIPRTPLLAATYVAALTCNRHLEGPFLSPIRLAEAEWFGGGIYESGLCRAVDWVPEPFLVLRYRRLTSC